MVLNNEYKYFDELENAAKISRYVKTRNISQLPEAIQSIIRVKNQQASQHSKTARLNIEKALIIETDTMIGKGGLA